MRLFVDTSAFYALASQNDAFHQKAKTHLKKLITGHEFITTSYIVAETLALLQNRGGKSAALHFLDSLNRGKWVEILWISEKLHLEGCRLFLKNTAEVSFVDCVSFAAMHHHSIKYFFGFDEHFEKAGFISTVSGE
ncbi:MAG: PIN domain-containing protein [Candidatus Eremiobacteraeota bacterium]|nr:PIN domain-containing protein [Candidatus Eremiobacteraeota bacterium]